MSANNQKYEAPQAPKIPNSGDRIAKVLPDNWESDGDAVEGCPADFFGPAQGCDEYGVPGIAKPVKE